MQEISAVCDHIMIISHGKLVLSGTPEQLQKDANKEENLELEAEATKEKMLQVLSGVSGIKEILDRKGESEQTCALYLKCERDIRREVFDAFAKAGIPVLKLVKDVKTLEDIFLDATREKWEQNTEEDVTEVSAETTKEEEEA
jgi:ABC-2 type transport system ATP-binding protein